MDLTNFYQVVNAPPMALTIVLVGVTYVFLYNVVELSLVENHLENELSNPTTSIVFL